MTLVRLQKKYAIQSRDKLSFTNAESAIEDENGVYVTFEEGVDEYDRQEYFQGYTIVAVGR